MNYIIEKVLYIYNTFITQQPDWNTVYNHSCTCTVNLTRKVAILGAGESSVQYCVSFSLAGLGTKEIHILISHSNHWTTLMPNVYPVVCVCV